MPIPSTRIKTLLAATAATVAAAFCAAPASAGVLVESAPGCTSPDSSKVFSPWLDYANYFLAPDGGFEAGAEGWDLSDGATVVAGNSSHAVSGEGSGALALPAGSRAVTPTICVGLEHPTMRFFIKKTSGTGPLPALNSLRVDVLVEDQLGLVDVLPLGVVSGSGSWQPSPAMLVSASLLPLLPGSHTPVAFRFVPQGGSWQVDDVYVDPYGTR